MSVEVSHDLFLDAARIESPEEMYRLGLEASTPGLGDKTDLVTAHKWFNLAALQGNELAREYRQLLTLEMTTAEIARAQRAAREWLQRYRPAVAA